MLQIMKEYGWDYHTYMAQPTWVLDLACEKLKIEAILSNAPAEQQPQTHG